MYPSADVPVLQLSMPRGASTRELFDLGRSLSRRLREDGVLVIGAAEASRTTSGACREATTAIARVGERIRCLVRQDALNRHDIDALLDYRARAPRAVLSHPTDEHYRPLLVAIGAASRGESCASNTRSPASNTEASLAVNCCFHESRLTGSVTPILEDVSHARSSSHHARRFLDCHSPLAWGL